MNVLDRLYEDYFKKSRLQQYEELLQYAKRNNYRMMGIYEYFEYLRLGHGQQNKKIIVNRHDIDTSPKVAKKMFQIEKYVYGETGKSTFYFRKCTTDTSLIKEIELFGYETGYHYEEIADYEKKHKYKDIDTIKRNIPQIQKQFATNLIKFRTDTGSKSMTVASHGDFINVKYNYGNLNILKEETIRKELGIFAEAYDDIINSSIDLRFADQKLLDKFSATVIQAICDGVPRIQILTHPRNWEVDVGANTVDNMKRVYQGFFYNI